MAGVVLGAVGILFVQNFPKGLVDQFYQREIEARIMATWKRQAVDLGYADCRETPSKCLGKIVVWPVTRLEDGTSYWGTKISEPVRWRNLQQVPFVRGPNYPFEAISRIVDVQPDAVVLLYIGTTEAQYSGTTFKRNFGYESSAVLVGGQ